MGTIYLLLSWKELQLQARANLPSGQSPRFAPKWRLGGPLSRYGQSEEQKDLSFQPGIERRVCSLVKSATPPAASIIRHNQFFPSKKKVFFFLEASLFLKKHRFCEIYNTRPLALLLRIRVKVKVTLVQALRFCTVRTAYRGSRGIALPFHDHGTRRGQRHAPAALYPRERPCTQCRGGWVDPRAGLATCGKSRPHRYSIAGPSSP